MVWFEKFFCVCVAFPLNVTFASVSIFKFHITYITRPGMSIPGCHTDFCYYLGPSLSFCFHCCQWKTWSHTLKIWAYILNFKVNLFLSVGFMISCYARIYQVAQRRANRDTMQYEPELSIMSFSQLLNTSSCPSENSEMRGELCQNSVWLHISIPVLLALTTLRVNIWNK